MEKQYIALICSINKSEFQGIHDYNEPISIGSYEKYIEFMITTYQRNK